MEGIAEALDVAAAASATSSADSAEVTASGFSQTTCRPAARMCFTCG
jgi:hypothetical protein